ncbi:MAG TPA: hypothetical protein VII13_09015 [Vicinamibacteria bacterium]|jgi:hypothetical protein
MHKASWILLALVGALTLLGSLASLATAYRGTEDQIVPGGTTIEDVRAWREDVATALKGRRGTASAYAASYAALFLCIVLIPYRRGEVWAWWALGGAALLFLVLTALRVPMLGYTLGIGTAVTQAAIVLVALLLDVGRLRRPPPA